MEFLSRLSELLLEFPSYEHRHCWIHPSQCQALCFYFCSNLEKFFDTNLQPSSSDPSSSALIRRRNSFLAFYDKTLMKLRYNRKSSKPTMEDFGDHSSAIVILEELKTVPNAVEEILRVMVEAEHYLRICGDSDWWRAAISLGFMTEVRDVHIHDLMWCIAGLKLALQTVRGVQSDSRAQFTRLSLAQCYAEMEEFSSPTSELIRYEEQDIGHLYSIVQQANQKYDDMGSVRKMFMNSHEKGKYGLVQSLFQRPGHTSNSLEGESKSPFLQKLPQSLCIMTRDLLFSLPTRVIAQDRFASVLEASWHGVKVAAKKLDYHAHKEYFTYQVDVHVKLKYPFILQLYGWSMDFENGSCYLLFELVKDTLATVVTERKESKKPLCLHVIVDLMLQLARALEYSHNQGVLHKDIMPYNVRVQPASSCEELMEKGYARVKLSDFGFDGFNPDVSDAISLGYKAPEVWALHGKNRIEQLDYTSEADVYSFGMTFAYCLLGEDPFAGFTSVGSLRDELQRGLNLNLPLNCPLVLRELLHNCVSKSLSARPSFGSITMMLRHLKLSLMKYRDTDELLNQSVTVREFFLSTPVMSYTELCCATSDFATRVQNISLHAIYYGVLSDGTKVLIQQMQGLMDLRKLWLQTFQLLNLRHSNIAGLRAVCIEPSRHWFVIENCFVRGSLDKWLELDNTQEQLDVAICYKIALGAACGLQYLHAQGIIYTVTAENILLDERYEPQLLVCSVQFEARDEERKYHQRLDVVHFGTLITKILFYLTTHNITADDPPMDSQAYVLKRVENLCASVDMEEIVEVLESIYDSCNEDNLAFDFTGAPSVDTAGSSKVMESCHQSFSSFDLTQNIVEYIDSIDETLHSQDTLLKSI